MKVAQNNVSLRYLWERNPSKKSVYYENQMEEYSEFRIPYGTKCLDFGFLSNQKITKDLIPPSVTHLRFGHFYNQPIEEGVIPSSVTHLIFGYSFNQVLTKNSIPSSVTHLAFGDGYQQSIEEGIIPSSVKYLSFGSNLSLFGKIKIPKSIHSVYLDGRTFWPSMIKMRDEHHHLISELVSGRIQRIILIPEYLTPSKVNYLREEQWLVDVIRKYCGITIEYCRYIFDE